MDLNFTIDNVPLAPVRFQPWYAPRVWYGMNTAEWLRLLAENRFRVYYKRLPLATAATALSLIPSIGGPLQRCWAGRQARTTPLVADPIILLGHWRTGTTYLHELFTLDPNLAYPTTFQCFSPTSFLISEHWLRPLTHWCIPPERPMDKVRIDWDAPQEDEFALLLMGLPTPYRRMAWPNRCRHPAADLDAEQWTEQQRRRWRQGLMTFVRYLNIYYRRQLVLKSPPHTARIAALLEMFPQARFVHITRNPQKVIPSTLHLWATLDFSNALQRPHFENLLECVFARFECMYGAYFRDEPLLGPHNLVTVRFEDLTRDAESVMRQIYAKFELPGFEQIVPGLRARIAANQQFQKNQHPLPEALQQQIAERCQEYCERFGYPPERQAA